VRSVKTIKALSVRQPWANAILLGKDVENRSRYFSHRGLLLIHASTHLDYRARRDPRIKALPENELIFGHLIGLVMLVDCVTESNSQWADRSARWKLILANPTRLSRPVPCRGSLNLFEVDERLVRDLLPSGALHELPPGMLPLHVS
jgi:hypothetical protein